MNWTGERPDSSNIVNTEEENPFIYVSFSEEGSILGQVIDVVVGSVMTIIGGPGLGFAALSGTLPISDILKEELDNSIFGLPQRLADEISKGTPFGTFLSDIGTALRDIGLFVWQILEFVVHAISWLISNGIHLLALWVVLSVYLLGVYATNGITNAVTRSRARRKEPDILNIKVFDGEIREAFSQYMRLVTLNMSLIGAMTGLLLTTLKLISPF